MGPVPLGSKLGWLLSGPVTKHNSSCLTTHAENSVMQIVNCIIDEKKIENFWNLDLLGIQENERSAYKKVLSGTQFVSDRYEVKLSFKKNVSLVSDNYEMSQNRLNKLKKKLSQNRDNLIEYNTVMKDQLKNGIIEKVEGPGNPRKVMYLPHQAVIRKDHSSTKLRVVFDASAKKVGPTLNDAMYKGPCLTPLLFDVLVRFRLNPIGIIADIEKAYLQISVADCHRDFLRFLWFDDVFKDIPEEVIFRFCRVIFGANCSQYLLNSVIRYHAGRYKDIDKNFSEKVAKSFYVDDFNSTVHNVTEGEQLYKKIKLRFLDASFNVRKWKTNSLELQNYIDKMERSISPSSDI